MAEETNSDERDDLVDEIVAEFLRRLRQNEKPSTADFAKEYPDLAPGLEKRLELVESIYKSVEKEESEKTILSGTILSGIEQPASLDKTERGHSTVMVLSGNFAARIACPHCGNKVQLVGLASNEVTCGSCGSSVKIVRPPSSSVSKDVLPNRIGRFTVKRILGEGAFGIVYLASDPQLGRDVAVKTPRNGFFPSLDEERRFFREAKHAASLQHPNIVQVFEVCETEAAPFIVSEYIQGLTLNDVANGNLLTFKETARLMIQIANAVEFAHQKGVVHRDLKPGNILLDADRNAYITDFGLAYVDDAEITMTLDGVILGTPAYMSPEQAEGNQKLVGRRSDVYSLGVILYRLTTKDLPFHGTKRMLVQQVINDDPKPPRILNDRIPRDLETIILKAMAKSPDARYQTAGQLAEELQRFLMGEPILARPISSLARFSRWCARRPAIAALSGSIGALLVSCATISTLWAMHSNRLTHTAIKNEILATRYGLESSHRLHDLLMSNGVTELKQNNLTNSSLWFAEALAIEDRPIDRVRMAMIQDRMPTLTHLLTGPGSCNMAFSSSGSRFFCSYPNSVRVFETQTKKVLFDEQLYGLGQVRFAPDGTKLAIAGEKAKPDSISLWNVDTRRLTASLTHSDEIQSIEFDANSSKLVTGSVDSTAKVWNANDGKLIAQHSFEGFRVARVAFIPDSNSVAIIINRSQEWSCKIVIWDYVQDILVGDEMLHDSFVANLRVSADGKQICAGEEGGTIKVWEAISGKQLGTSISTNKKLLDAQFTANQASVIGLFANGEVATFDYQSGDLLTLFFRPTKFNLLSQSPDSSILALASADGKVVFVWRETGADVCTPINNGQYVNSIVFHPDGHRVAVAGSTGALQLWDLAGSCANSFIFQHDGSVTNAFFVPRKNRCLTVSLDGKGYLWDIATGQRVGDALEHTQAINCASASTDGSFIVTGGADSLVKVWDSFTGKQVGRTCAHDAVITSAKFTADGARLFASDKGGTIRCWEVSAETAGEPTPLFELQQNAEVNSLGLSNDGKTLASASTNGQIRLWNAATGQPSSVQLKHGTRNVVFRFMPDDKRLISSGQNDESTVIWELATGKPLIQLPNENRVWDVQVAANGKRLVIIDLIGIANVWIADEDGKYTREKTFRLAPNVFALSAALNVEQSMFAMCGGVLMLQPGEPHRGAINLWSFSDGRPLAPTFQQRASVRQLAFSGDAKQMITMSDENAAQLWNISSSDLPIVDLKRISQLYAQNVPNVEGGLKLMDIDSQREEFEELFAKHPSYFTVNEADQKIWDYELKQNSSDDQ